MEVEEFVVADDEYLTLNNHFASLLSENDLLDTLCVDLDHSTLVDLRLEGALNRICVVFDLTYEHYFVTYSNSLVEFSLESIELSLIGQCVSHIEGLNAIFELINNLRNETANAVDTISNCVGFQCSSNSQSLSYVN